MLSDDNNHCPPGGQPTGHHKTLFIKECSGSVVECLTQDIGRQVRASPTSVFVCFVALRPKSTAMVMAWRSFKLTTLFLGKLDQVVNQYFVHILSLVTDNNPSWMIQQKGGENDRRNYFMINPHKSMGPDRDRIRNPWICSQAHICCQTRYRLRYAAQ